ncbi:MAG TPA: type II toxin-antitoxin system death-on-curing family toxin [Vicinamibacterales bacterium]|nr:type II toxin-antitoxin system death-on-curing family toxin [Vicinamibacterales bacterium]
MRRQQEAANASHEIPLVRHHDGLGSTASWQRASEHGGQTGLRDAGLLESALARPVHIWSYAQGVDLAGLAAEYGFGLAKNHAFPDGNKRIAFVATNVFLLLNGFEIEAPEPEAVNIMLGVADGSLTRDEFAAWIRSRMVPFSE